ncbi:MAG TPA: hypothetical protein VE961_17555 [Pyrinomonadaceae bacterium]|nr:hypothetical protein [Pyrinomonadaceae bacterium]
MKKTLIALSVISLLLCAAAGAAAQGLPIYNDIPSPLAGNYPSQPFQAQQASEFGDRVAFAPGGRALRTVTVTMSSWACQTGGWTVGCTTAAGATFTHPITLNIYNVGPGNSVGSLLATKTQVQTIPYRPSSDFANCGDARWYDGSTCFNGKAANISFDLTSLNVTLPNQVIVGIAYNTSNYGYSPLGTQPCSSTVQGCPYDSLNVALVNPALTQSVGVNPAPSDAYFNTQTAFWYCDGGASGVGTFRLDAGCWTGFKPALKINAANVPLTKDDCKGDGWQTRTNGAGQPFPNQGQCIQYVNTGK